MIHHNQPAADYFATPGVSKSALDDFARCPAYYKARRDGKIERTETPAMQFGTLLHGLVLLGKADFHVKPDGMTFASRDGKAWKESHSDKPILSAVTAAELQAMASAILRHPHAAPLFGNGKAEVALTGVHRETGLPIKGRTDWIGSMPSDKHRLVDIKTTNDASDAGVFKYMKAFRGWMQAAIYTELANQNNLMVDDFYFVFIERGEIPLINIWLMSQDDLERGKIIFDAEMRRLKSCIDTDTWPDYSGATPIARNIPEYCFGEKAETELIDLEEAETKTTEGDLIP